MASFLLFTTDHLQTIGLGLYQHQWKNLLVHDIGKLVEAIYAERRHVEG